MNVATVLISRAECFARKRHATQIRKGEAKEPYITHVEEVARLTEKWGGTEEAICAAWLHDTVEDCPPTSFEELSDRFSETISNLVRELTDDKSLPKAERKRLQILNANHKSEMASLIKIADMTSNFRSIAGSPPANWSYVRRIEYLDWGTHVVEALPYKNDQAMSTFEEARGVAKERAESDLEVGHVLQS